MLSGIEIFNFFVSKHLKLLIIEHRPANYKLCFLSEEKLFSFIVDLNRTILASFITRIVWKNETKLRNNMYCSPDCGKFFETPCIFEYIDIQLFISVNFEVKQIILKIGCIHRRKTTFCN